MAQRAKDERRTTRAADVAWRTLSLDRPTVDSRRRQAFEVLRAYYEAVQQGLAPAD